MEKRLVFFGIAAVLLLVVTSAGLAGVEPSPFEPEINKLHSIELQVAAINKRLEKINAAEALPEGLPNYLIATTNHMQLLKERLDEVLLVLPSPSPLPGGTYIGQDAAVFALDSIRADTRGTFGIMEKIVSRMGVEPSPFLPLFKDVTIGIVSGINIHVMPVLPPLELP